MIKIIKTIVNSDRNLIGLMLSGTDRDFGGLATDSVVERGETIQSIIQKNFKNNQIAVNNGKLVEQGNFRLNDLPMVLLSQSQKGATYIPVGNRMYLTKRYLNNEENVGFRVRFDDGSEDNLKYDIILTLSKWFKPGNFVIRTSASKKQFIAGKPGVLVLNDLPAIDVSTRAQKSTEESAKRTKSGAKKSEQGFTGNVEVGFDIVDLYDFIEDNGGCTIYLPTEKYEAATEKGAVKLQNFTSLGIGEVAATKPMYTPNKINVNARFRKVGIVPVNIGGIQQNIVTYVNRTKSIFLKGENYVKRFGIAIPVDKEKDLVDFLGNSLALEKITDPSVTNPLGQVIDSRGLSFYKIDASKLDLLSANKRKECIKSIDELKNMTITMREYKLITKATGSYGLMKKIKEEVGESELNKALGKKPFGIFSAMNDEALSNIQSAGINIFDGSYTEQGEVDPEAAKKAQYADADKEESVEIEYVVTGLGELTGNKILELVKDGDPKGKLPKTVFNTISKLLEINDPVQQYKKAREVNLTVTKYIDKLTKDFWKHNAAMYIEGGKVRVHTHDASDWELTTDTKVKTAKVYKCVAPGFENFEVRLKGVEI
jgi:hypothetical protein